MYEEVFNNLEKQLPTSVIKELRNKTIHLGIFSEPYLTYMLDGKKIVESRFSKNRILPYHQIGKEDIVLVKKSSGKVIAYFTIQDVFFFDLNITPIEELKSKYHQQLCVDESFWISKKDSNYATLIFIDQLVKLQPFSIKKKGMQTWMKLK